LQKGKISHCECSLDGSHGLPAFSKKLENHAYSVALHYMHYNFCRIHKTLRITPAMAADVSDHVWSVADIVSMIEAAESAPGKRGLYKKRAV
jgi:hypothetical protein